MSNAESALLYFLLQRMMEEEKENESESYDITENNSEKLSVQ